MKDCLACDLTTGRTPLTGGVIFESIGWTPGHIHFVIQPAWDRDGEKHPAPGPFLQVDLFNANKTPLADEVEAFCVRVRVREVIHQLTASTGTSVSLPDRFPPSPAHGRGGQGVRA